MRMNGLFAPMKVILRGMKLHSQWLIVNRRKVIIYLTFGVRPFIREVFSTRNLIFSCSFAETECSKATEKAGEVPYQSTSSAVVQPTSTGAQHSDKRKSCTYGASCYRQNPQHRHDEAHPGDSDYVVSTNSLCSTIVYTRFIYNNTYPMPLGNHYNLYFL